MTLVVDYRERMASLEWQYRRWRSLHLGRNRCGRCGDSGTDIRLEIHHLSYDRLGNEDEADLIPLCRTCHENTHDDVDEMQAKGLDICGFPWMAMQRTFSGDDDDTAMLTTYQDWVNMGCPIGCDRYYEC